MACGKPTMLKSPVQGQMGAWMFSGRQVTMSSRGAGPGGTHLIMRVHIVVTIVCRRAGNWDAPQITAGHGQV